MSTKLRSEGFPQMSGAHEITPGPIVGPAPEPTEIVCIQVDKIFDACSQRHCFEDIRFEFRGVCDFIRCRVVPNSFEAECTLTQVQDDPPLVRARVDFTFELEVECDGQVRRRRLRASNLDPRTFPKDVILFGVADEMFCKVEAVLECLGCDKVAHHHHDEGESSEEGVEAFRHRRTILECDVGVFLEIKTAAHVQLLIPSFGFCPVPPECQELPTRCEEFLTGPPPRRFPPQPFEFAGEH